MLLGTGDGHIEQATLLLQFAHGIGAHRRREDILLQAHDKDRRELQTFGSVNGHQHHLVVVIAIVTVEIGQKSHLLQKVSKIDLVAHVLLATAFDKVLHTTEELLEILLTRNILGVMTAVDVAADTARHNNIVAQLIGILHGQALSPAIYELPERIYLGKRSLVHFERKQHRVGDDTPQADTVVIGRTDNLVDGRIADAACRIVDNTLESLLVVGVGHQAEVGYDVLDFLALVERQTAVDAVRDVVLAHLLLERTALCIRAVQDGKVAPMSVLLTAQPLDVLTHDDGLFAVGIGRLQRQHVAHLVAAIHILLYLAFILAYQRVGSLHDKLRRAVVLLQLEKAGAVIGLAEVQDIVDVGSAETVDALGIVADDTDTLALTCQLQDNLLLRVVRVLILIDQYEAELLDILPAHVLVLLEKHISLHQQVVEVHRVSLTATLGIAQVDILDGRTLRYRIVSGPSRTGIVDRQYQVVLGHRDTVGHRGRLVDFVIESHLLDDGLH